MDIPTLKQIKWYQQNTGEVFDILKTSMEGLAAQEAELRLVRFGYNRLTEKKRSGPLKKFLLHFHDLLIYVLLAAAAVTALMREWVDCGVIFGVVIINAIIGFLQESKAEQALTLLKKMFSLRATVIRSGAQITVPAELLVPGDAVLLTAGDHVPADLRFVKARNLQANEAALTGESLPVSKSTNPVSGAAGIGDRINMGFNGTFIISGQGIGIVTATGDDTELGRIAVLLQDVEEVKTPLTRRLAVFSKSLTMVIIAGCVVVFVYGTFIRGLHALDMFMAAVAIAISAIPEGLPAIMTITLAIGVTRMVQRNAIIRKLPVVETLGSTRIICTDKTGTLTRNEMVVTRIITTEGDFSVTGSGYAPVGDFQWQGATADISACPVLVQLLRAGLLCNDAVLRQTGSEWHIDGDPTEGALVVAAAKAQLQRQDEQQARPRKDTIPFEPELQFMATLHQDHGNGIIYSKGAPEQIISLCRRVTVHSREAPLDGGLWEERARDMAAGGLRVIAVAGKRVSGEYDSLCLSDIKAGDFTLLGLAGMRDPLRPEALAAVNACKQAGINIKMITGDHALTADAIASEIGLGHDVITGTELDQLADDEFDRAVSSNSVFARVNPGHKLRLVRSLQKQGEIVAMTGDGVNDAPALKQADIGIAMGITGTEVAKDAADMVITDDNFASIERAIEEGRTVINNLKKTILFILPTNGGECLVIIWAILTGTLLPVLPLHILWINMITTVALAITLAFEPVERGVMQEPPREPDAPIFEPLLIWRIVLVSVVMAAGTFGLFYYEIGAGESLEYARTTAVNTIVFFEIFYVLNTRYLTASVLNLEGISGNRIILFGAAMVIVFQMIFTYWPVSNQLFQSEPLTLWCWLRVIAVAGIIFFIVEAEKAVNR
jgi:magnesium-transporting ATPase (P-type)